MATIHDEVPPSTIETDETETEINARISIRNWTAPIIMHVSIRRR